MLQNQLSKWVDFQHLTSVEILPCFSRGRVSTVSFSCASQNTQHQTPMYYEDKSEGLGIRFKQEIRSSIEMILEFPKLYPMATDAIGLPFVLICRIL